MCDDVADVFLVAVAAARRSAGAREARRDIILYITLEEAIKQYLVNNVMIITDTLLRSVARFGAEC
eukprot:scaffold12193_cov122-Skeletonema_dohrnii-CCMP3373.AAC.1